MKRIPNVNLYRKFKMVNIISKKQFLKTIFMYMKGRQS